MMMISYIIFKDIAHGEEFYLVVSVSFHFCTNDFLLHIMFALFHMKYSCFLEGIGSSSSVDEVVDEVMGGTDAHN
jgi:hypothetical protein